MALGIVPMCSYQMERMFNTTRIPGKETGTRQVTALGPREAIVTEPFPPAMGPPWQASHYLFVPSALGFSGWCNCQKQPVSGRY